MTNGTIILACDFGGTNAQFAAYERRAYGMRRTLYATRPSSRGMATCMDSFLDELSRAGHPAPARACLAAAGPVASGRCELTNLGEIADAAELSSRYGFPFSVVNDFVAAARGICALDPGETGRYASLREGAPFPSEPRRVLVAGAGTGFGAAFVAEIDGRPRVFTSEGGHASLPAFDALSADFAAGLRGTPVFDPPDAELGISGRGLARIHEFLCDRYGADGADETILGLDPASRPEAIATGAGKRCGEARAFFTRLFARACSDLALTFMANEVWIAGGIAPKNLGALAEDDRFAAEFSRNRVASLSSRLSRIPVRVVLDYSVSLDGAAAIALESGEPRDEGPGRRRPAT
jgi:glucokinase